MPIQQLLLDLPDPVFQSVKLCNKYTQGATGRSRKKMLRFPHLIKSLCSRDPHGVRPHNFLRVTIGPTFERDDYTCKMCGERGGQLEADHILKFAHHVLSG